jgi:rhamnose transport system ATP-binding protein
VEVRQLGKVFGSTVACSEVSFGVRAGEVLALVGENGAGKSTCVKMLGGVYQPDVGEILVNDQMVDLDNPVLARNHGISVVHQHPELFGDLTVAENVFAGDLRTKGPWVDQERMQAEARELLVSLGLDFDVTVALDSLRISEQQLVEIARALAAEARVLILDEPTAALTTTEVARLFEIVDRLRRDNVAIIFVGHRLEEILGISDRITVLRDGQVVGTIDTGDIDRSGLVTMMVGRELDSTASRTPYPTGDKVLETSHL